MKPRCLPQIVIVVLLLFLSSCYYFSPGYKVSRTNIMKAIQSYPSFETLYQWTLIELDSEVLLNGPCLDSFSRAEPIFSDVHCRIALCHVPNAKEWVFLVENDTSKVEKDTERKMIVEFDSFASSSLQVVDHSKECQDLSTNMVLYSQYGITNILNVALFRQIAPTCSALFISTGDGNRENTIIAKFIFPGINSLLSSSECRNNDSTEYLIHHATWKCKAAIRSSRFSILLSTNEFSDLLRYLAMVNKDDQRHYASELERFLPNKTDKIRLQELLNSSFQEEGD